MIDKEYKMHELEAEIEHLEMVLESKDRKIEKLEKENENLKEQFHYLDVECCRLEKENEIFADIGKMYSEVRAEVVKEFAKKLFATFEQYEEYDSMCIYEIIDRIEIAREEMGVGLNV